MINALNRSIFGTGGGASATIYVTGLQEADTVTMTTPSGATKQGEWGEEQGESVFIFHANEYGMHTIEATNGTKTTTEEVLVDALMDYWVEMAYVKYFVKDGVVLSHYERLDRNYSGRSGNITENPLKLYRYGAYETQAVFDEIDLTKFNSINVILSDLTATDVTWCRWAFGYDKYLDNVVNGVNIHHNNADINVVKTYDISQLNGLHTVYICDIADTVGNNSTIAVKDFWLE